MIQVAEEFIEAVDGGQIFVAVAQVVLAELAGGVTLRFERGGNRTGLGGESDLGSAWPTVVIPVRMGSSPVMKFARPAVQLASA